jgi:hypothetical protein
VVTVPVHVPVYELGMTADGVDVTEFGGVVPVLPVWEAPPPRRSRIAVAAMAMARAIAET